MKAAIQPMKHNKSFRADEVVAKSVSRKQAKKAAKLLKVQNQQTKDDSRYASFQQEEV